ncbi:DNA sulfur modification protein DndE [Anoxybacter fermentans]|uniref:DNA sulfur modification protein DndE n=1 Tax=Anoxybacter fermentans TaxID=1323375 RepID=A0A3Q9HNN4_9FIRM|nr:DNA sulfur modification protein DndE [Anoxybacter fermentans]AZR72163.1 DNA sulfur modification protein DndE [Anoxybacter fermentans]
MIFKLKTSKETMEILKDLQAKTNLTPNVLSRLAISCSLLDNTPVDEFESDNNGLEFNRHTLTGDYDLVFKVLISQHCNRHLTDEEYFPTYIKKHLDRGAKILKAEYQYTGNYEKFLIHLTKLNDEVIL